MPDPIISKAVRDRKCTIRGCAIPKGTYCLTLRNRRSYQYVASICTDCLSEAVVEEINQHKSMMEERKC